MTTRNSPFDRRRIRSFAGALLAIVVATFDADAGPPSLSQGNAWRRRVEEERLYLDPGWLALLAYRPLPLDTGWKSEADKPDFFLSPRGQRDPRAEMLADIEAFFLRGQEDPDPDHAARCRFPARFAWLREKLDVDAGGDVRDGCPALRAWRERVAGDRVTISFASAYLESPSSMFGHTFLRFERDGVPTLQTTTSNHEADSSRDTGAVAFVARGLFGGFPGIAEQQPFHRRLRVYGDIEGRDVWEYPLHLDARAAWRLLDSLWETRDGTFDYFFLGENCAYRTLALLAVARPDARLLDPFPMEVVPIDTIRVLQDRGLVGEPLYRPSAVRTLSRHARDLSAAEQRTVVAIAHGRQTPEVVANLPRENRARLFQAAAEYSSILIHRGQLDFETRDRVTRDLFRARLALDLPLPPDPVPPPPPPDQAHGGRLVSLGWVNQRGVDGVELGVAGFQHERIDRLAGYEKGAEIVVLGGRTRLAGNGGLRLENLDVLRIESTTPSDRFFQQPAWGLRLGAARKHVDHGKPLLGTLAYARGRAFHVGLGVLALTLGASLDSASELRGDVAMEAVAAARLVRQHAWWSAEAFLEHGRYVFGDDSHRIDYGLRMGIPLARRQALVLEFQRGGADSQENIGRVELRTFF